MSKIPGLQNRPARSALECAKLAFAFPEITENAMENSSSQPAPTLQQAQPIPAVQHRNWPHAPPHKFVPGTAYIITSGTYLKKHLLPTPSHLSLVRNALFDHAEEYGWRLDAWAVLINHYHIIAQSTNGRENLSAMLQAVHSKTAISLNEMDGTPGRQVWWNYRDTCLTYQQSYLARLHYVHRNPERHGVVKRAEDYPWCSMSWFIQETQQAFRASVLSFKIDRLNVPDDF